MRFVQGHQTRIKPWGNSIAMRLPKGLIQQLGWSDDELVSITTIVYENEKCLSIQSIGNSDEDYNWHRTCWFCQFPSDYQDKTRVRRWGNSLAIRFLSHFVFQQVSLVGYSVVKLYLDSENRKLIVKPVL